MIATTMLTIVQDADIRSIRKKEDVLVDLLLFNEYLYSQLDIWIR